MHISQQILSDITVHMKYAAYLPELNRREVWREIVDRNIKMHLEHYKDVPTIQDELKAVYGYVYDKKVLPSMRSLQFAGPAIRQTPSRIFNCSYMAVDDYRAFNETMFLLLCGCGVGFSVQRHHVSKLPPVYRPTKQRRYLIADSIEGWADAVKALIKAYLCGKPLPVFDYSDIRPKGRRLKTSGGKAPGPEPLKDCLHNIQKVLDRKQDGEQLRPIDVYDVMCFLAEAVLAGGIRRSAMIALFSPDDEDMLTCKYEDWAELNPQRARCNNSVVLLRAATTEEQFNALWTRLRASGTGEPGFFFTDDLELGTNPCGEISLKSLQFCVAHDTPLITKDEIKSIGLFVNKKVTIWNGEQWVSVIVRKTGSNQELMRVHLSDGSYLDCTPYHRWSVKDRFHNNWAEVQTKDLMSFSKYAVQVEPASVKSPETGITYSDAYTLGFAIGDGCIAGDYVFIDLYGNKQNCPVIGSRYPIQWNYTKTAQYIRVNAKAVDQKLFKNLRSNPSEWLILGAWCRDSVLQFVAGLADSDGSETGTGGIRVYTDHYDKCRALQLVLAKHGIRCSIALCQSAGTETNLATRQRDLWYVQITDCNQLPCHRLNTCDGHNPKYKGKYQVIESVEPLGGLHDVYCFDEPKRHKGMFGNVLTHQCNLTEINVSDVTTQQELNDRARVAAFIGTLQAGYTDLHYLRDEWRRNTEREALLGCSMTGIASGSCMQLNLEEAAKIMVQENERVAKLININVAARIGCVKPAGTTSCVLGCSSGIHDWHAPYYIRNIRVGKSESIYRYLVDTLPDLIEDDILKPASQAVLSIPQKAPNGALIRSSAIELLERVKHVTQHWIWGSHRSGTNHHNVSCTVSVRDHEWDNVRTWMWNNRQCYTGLTVLPFDGGNYKQAPFQEIDQERYNAMLPRLRSIDLSEVHEHEDNTNLLDQAACAGGACKL